MHERSAQTRTRHEHVLVLTALVAAFRVADHVVERVLLARGFGDTANGAAVQKDRIVGIDDFEFREVLNSPRALRGVLNQR